MSPAPRADEVGTVEEGPLAAVLAALARDDPNGVVAALDGQLHHGQPGSPASLRYLVGERLATALAPQKGRVTRWIDALATSPSPTARQVACLLLVSRYPDDPDMVLSTAEGLADDPHWEVREAAGGLLGTLSYAIICAAFVPQWGERLTGAQWAVYLAGAAVLCAASIVGDLFESAAKRQAGVKDSGEVLPGHGGILDRIDSATSTLPLAAVLLPLIVGH